ncbi:hypothetical protein BWQ96_00331 [Gracilariopsis chorda]|uniref:Uncharacterized protein n=1 Tax=Gracilariopsis chorda TaxID=448386 RepID=A0A2V3J6X4_9FLOR|nr:hypothetical protein BWQ96_00331 [Gracilariopsis chorda]|eukprot:PXF50171.1 hypothetical protein BWQ96_00331 [Gracilariopsis chorda]
MYLHKSGVVTVGTGVRFSVTRYECVSVPALISVSEAGAVHFVRHWRAETVDEDIGSAHMFCGGYDCCCRERIRDLKSRGVRDGFEREQRHTGEVMDRSALGITEINEEVGDVGGLSESVRTGSDADFGRGWGFLLLLWETDSVGGQTKNGGDGCGGKWSDMTQGCVGIGTGAMVRQRGGPGARNAGDLGGERSGCQVFCTGRLPPDWLLIILHAL